MQIIMFEAFKLLYLKHYHCHNREYSLFTTKFEWEALTLMVHILRWCIFRLIRVRPCFLEPSNLSSDRMIRDFAMKILTEAKTPDKTKILAYAVKSLNSCKGSS